MKEVLQQPSVWQISKSLILKPLNSYDYKSHITSVKDSPDGYRPYEETDFPPKILGDIANSIAFILTIFTIFYFEPSTKVPFLIAGIFGIIGNLYLHESSHYITQSRLGYDPVFDWPNKVWVPNEPLTVREGIISLTSPQLLTLLYVSLIWLSGSDVIDFMLTIALIFNVTGGLRDIAWVFRRLLWPKGNLVLVDSEGNEFATFPN